MRQTGSRHRILEVCEFRFCQFLDYACQVFSRIVTKIQTDLKLICIDFVSSINETRNIILEMFKILFWQYRDVGGRIVPRKNANSGHFEVAFDKFEFDTMVWQFVAR